MKMQNLIIHYMLITFFVTSGFIPQPNIYRSSKNIHVTIRKAKKPILVNKKNVTDHSG